MFCLGEPPIRAGTGLGLTAWLLQLSVAGLALRPAMDYLLHILIHMAVAELPPEPEQLAARTAAQPVLDIRMQEERVPPATKWMGFSCDKQPRSQLLSQRQMATQK